MRDNTDGRTIYRLDTLEGHEWEERGRLLYRGMAEDVARHLVETDRGRQYRVVELAPGAKSGPTIWCGVLPPHGEED